MYLVVGKVQDWKCITASELDNTDWRQSITHKQLAPSLMVMVMIFVMVMMMVMMIAIMMIIIISGIVIVDLSFNKDLLMSSLWCYIS